MLKVESWPEVRWVNRRKFMRWKWKIKNDRRRSWTLFLKGLPQVVRVSIFLVVPHRPHVDSSLFICFGNLFRWFTIAILHPINFHPYLSMYYQNILIMWNPTCSIFLACYHCSSFRVSIWISCHRLWSKLLSNPPLNHL